MLEPEGDEECKVVGLVGMLMSVVAAVGEDMSKEQRELALTLANKWNSDMAITRDMGVTVMAGAALMTSLMVAMTQMAASQGTPCMCGAKAGHWPEEFEEFKRQTAERRRREGEDRGSSDANG